MATIYSLVCDAVCAVQKKDFIHLSTGAKREKKKFLIYYVVRVGFVMGRRNPIYAAFQAKFRLKVLVLLLVSNNLQSIARKVAEWLKDSGTAP